MGFLYTKIQRPRGSAPRGPLRECRFLSRRGPRTSKYFFFAGRNDREGIMSTQGGGVAQLGEHHVRNVGVEGSIPFSSTIFFSPSVHLFFLSVEERSPFSAFYQERIVTRVLCHAASCVGKRRLASASSEGVPSFVARLAKHPQVCACPSSRKSSARNPLLRLLRRMRPTQGNGDRLPHH